MDMSGSSAMCLRLLGGRGAGGFWRVEERSRSCGVARPLSLALYTHFGNFKVISATFCHFDVVQPVSRWVVSDEVVN